MASLLSIFLTTLSTLVGILILAASAVALDQYRHGIDDCVHDNTTVLALLPDRTKSSICQPFFAVAAVTAIGIVIGVIQILINIIILAGRGNVGSIWVGLHALIFLFTISTFGVAIHFLKTNNDSSNVVFNLYSDEHKDQFLIIGHGIDWAFTFLSLVLNSLIPKASDHHGYSSLGGT